MKRYDNEAETPLKFHKIYHYFIIPFGFLSGLLSLGTVILDMESFNYVYAVDYTYLILSVILAAVIFLGFYSFSSYAWYCLMGYLGIEIAYETFYLVMCILYLPAEITSQAINLITTAIITTLIIIYYIKRKPLFFPRTQTVGQAAAPSTCPIPVVESPEEPPLVESSLETEPLSEQLVRFCTNCGTPLNSDYVFCPNCGTARYIG